MFNGGEFGETEAEDGRLQCKWAARDVLTEHLSSKGGEAGNGRLPGEEAEGPARPNTDTAPSQSWTPAERQEQK